MSSINQTDFGIMLSDHIKTSRSTLLKDYCTSLQIKNTYLNYNTKNKTQNSIFPDLLWFAVHFKIQHWLPLPSN